MSSDRALLAWCDSSTTTMGFVPASAEMSAVSSAPSMSWAWPVLRWYSVSCMSEEFSAKARRPSLFLNES